MAACAYTTARLHRLAHAPYQCEMTYMYPKYHAMNVSSPLAARYGLFRYEDTGTDVLPPGACGTLFC